MGNYLYSNLRDKKKDILKSFSYICLTIIILFGLGTIVASGGGDGDNNGGGGSAPIISNLEYYPTSYNVDSGNGTGIITGSVEFIDDDGDVASMTITTFDSSDNQVSSSTTPITGISGMKSGTIGGEIIINTTIPGDYTFDVYINDEVDHKSNVLTGVLDIIDSPWRIKTSMPEDPLPLTRIAMGAANVNGKIYIIGGGGNDSRTLVYDTATDTWEIKSSILTNREQLAVSDVNGKIYAMGGFPMWDTVEEYDPINDTWATKAPMPTGRHGLATAVVNDKIYAIGGAQLSPGMDVVEEYDPVKNEWTTKAPMPTPRDGLSAAVVDGKIYAIGGTGFINNIVQEYDPVSNTWSTKSPMPTGRSDFGMAVANNKIYAFGGWIDGSGTPSDAVEEYDAATDTWTTKSAMPTPRALFVAVAESEKIYVIGGRYTYGDLGTVELYDPSKDQ